MTTTLVIPAPIASQIDDLVRLEVESAGILLARLVEAPNGDRRLLGRELLAVPEQAYERRERDLLQISSAGFVPALGRAETTGAVPIWFHTHPGDGASPLPSRHDDRVDEQLGDLFRLRAASPFYGALIVSRAGASWRFSGHLDSDHEQVLIDRLLRVGERIALTRNETLPQVPLNSLFDRNVLAFGGPVQQVLSELRVAIVGCGGTGSAVAEQLVRLGIRHLSLFDPDRLSATNLTRVYGSVPGDIGRAKVDVIADYLRRIAPDASIASHPSMITLEESARRLTGADIVFGCTDDNAGRLVLSRLATFLLLPVFDCGVLLSSDVQQRLDGIHGRVTMLWPGTACLVCRNRIDISRARSELLSPEERVRRVDEGYAAALEGTEPAVVAYTTLVAATAVSELLEHLTAYGPAPVPSEILLRAHDREISTNVQLPRERHYCHPEAGKLGLGITQPFLEQTWPTPTGA